MKNTSIILPALTVGLLSPFSFAGTETAETSPAQANSGDWCKSIQEIGKIYSDKSNPYIQSFSLEGRLQSQFYYIDGTDQAGNDFNAKENEFRRARLGAKVGFLQYFTAKAVVDLVDDQRSSGGDLGWGYENFDTATLTFDMKKAFSIGSLDSLNLTYGRHKFELSTEAFESSNNILTIERSAISNKVYNSARPTGLSLQAGKGDWVTTGAIYSAADQNEFINGGFNDGIAYFGALDYTGIDKFILRWDAVYNDADVVAGSELNYEWATSFNATYEDGPYGILGTLVLGDNGDQAVNRDGNFYGLTVMPWYWIVEDKLQGVVQYSYSGSEESEGIRTNSRYLRDDKTNLAAINNGRGDELHTLYAGLNYYLCGNNAKLMAGLEYADLNTPVGSVDSMTYLFGVRVKF